MDRREALAQMGAATMAVWLAQGRASAAGKRVLFFTKSSGFEHSVIKMKDGQPSHATTIFSQLAAEHGFELVHSKDGGIFTAENLAGFDVFCFYTTGNLTQPGTDGQPPMSAAAKEAFLAAIADGKGFVGIHTATDTFHSPGDRFKHNDATTIDPYIAMVGGEFIRHGKQQKSTMRVCNPDFPGLAAVAPSFDLHDEWYTHKNTPDDLHVLLAQETAGMEGSDYQRPPFPATWARRHGAGRVFYTSMGHREDVWTNPIFQGILLGGLAWAWAGVEVDVTPNVNEVTPGHRELQPKPEPKPQA